MDYYKQKRILRAAISEWLQQYIDAALPPDKENITSFVNKMAMDTGFSTKTIKKEFYLFRASIDNDVLVKR
jgi:hypothetical protein